MRVYFDNASTTPLLPEVQDEMTKIISEVYGNPSSIHLHGRQARIVIEEARKTIATGLNASSGEIFFTSGATEANNMALLASIRDLGVQRIISTTTEHHCILHTLDYIREREMAQVLLLEVDDKGQIDLEKLAIILGDGIPTLVSVMHGNNEIGALCDLEKLSQLCTQTSTLLHTDTAQTIAKLPFDLAKTKVSFLCGASHKFFGPKGVGFVYINNDNLIKPMFYGGDQERGMRSGTENIYGIAGMAKAFKMALDEMDYRKEKVSAVRSYFEAQLSATFEDIQFNSTSKGLYNICSVSFPPTPKSEMLMMNLDISGISASSGSACSSGVENDSHVLQAIGHNAKRKTVRFSFSHLNTTEEVDFVIEKLKTITPLAV